MKNSEYDYNGSEKYCYPGSDVLINKLGIRDEKTLLIAEREITSVKILMLYNTGNIYNLDFKNLCKIHQIIFEDIYEWAGHIRHGDFLSKGNSIFCRGKFIVDNANKIMKNLLNENYLKRLNKERFIERMAFYMGELNALHPFREGNGRTMREFFRQLSLNANYVLDFSKIQKEELLIADIEAFNGEYDNLMKILSEAVRSK